MSHKILFIDDEEKSVKYFQKAFGKHFNIIATTDLGEARNIVESEGQEIAVIISDQRMPGGSGVDFLTRVKEKNNNIIRILTTAYSSLEDSIDSINKSNVFAYLSKPWNFEEVNKTLNLALKEFKSRKKYLSLSGSIAHEMRNPLHTIKQSAELVRQKLIAMRINEIYCCNTTKIVVPFDKNDLDEIIGYIDATSSSVNRSNVIIDMILDSIKQKPVDSKSFQNISALEIIRTAISKYFFTEDEKKRIKLEIESNNDFIIWCNQDLFHYVFFNLFRNSFYYLKSHPDLEVKIRAEIGSDDYNRVYFRDNGPGIAQERLQDLFEAFSTHGKKGGTGLGLAFCQKSMESFGGTISCDSKEGSFTEFTLAFPKKQITLNPSQSQNSPRVISKEEAQKILENKKILIVDDDNTNLLLTAKFLRNYKAKVDEAANGEEALALNKSQIYDIILTDIEMPVMDGITTLKKIREFSEANNLKPALAIAFTGDNDEQKIAKILDADFDGYFIKGEDPSRIIDFIAAHKSQ